MSRLFCILGATHVCEENTVSGALIDMQHHCLCVTLPVMAVGNGTSRQVGVKNEPQEELLRQTILLRGSIGRKASLVVKQRHVQKVPSIQKPLAQTS